MVSTSAPFTTSVTAIVVPFEILSGYDIAEGALADGDDGAGDGVVTFEMLGGTRVAAGDDVTGAGG